MSWHLKSDASIYHVRDGELALESFASAKWPKSTNYNHRDIRNTTPSRGALISNARKVSQIIKLQDGNLDI